MKRMTRLLRIGTLMVALAFMSLWTSCSERSETSSVSSGGHYHAAPHGGSLVMLGDHLAQLELVPGNEEGDWILYVLDGGAERFVRIEQESIHATIDGREIVFRAVANSATGETVGSTAQFAATVEGLSGDDRFPVQIHEIVVFRQPFTQVEFDFPEGKH